MEKGISVVICSYNGQDRVEPVLQHLAQQILPPEIPCEILFIDNQSTDNTPQIAAKFWKSLNSSFPFRLIIETQQGTMHARRRGVYEAKYDIMIYCDDDNWFDANYLSNAHQILREHPHLAGAGGVAQAVFENDKPDWFDAYKGFYACGPQGTNEGVIKHKGSMFTAGLALRTQYLKDIFEAGFKNNLQGRSAVSMVAGEDSELTLFMSIVGMKFWYSPKLKFNHFMEERRLNRNYLKKITGSIGISKALLTPYEMVYKNEHQSILGKRNWQIIRYGIKHIYIFLFNPFGREKSIELLRNRNTISTLISMRRKYGEDIKRIVDLKNSYLAQNHG